MILRRFYDEKLAQTAYLIGCSATGEALVVDPNRDAGPIIAAAGADRLSVSHVTETHIHADFVSGARDLARRTGARLLLSAEGGPDWGYAYAADDDAVLLRDGDTFAVGNIRVDVVHTPGHTPEHVCFVITDTAGADRPMGVLTGDFIFAGDVGRPDLLERAAGVAGTTEEAARQLFRSIRAFTDRFDDYVQLWPGHGAGSACGKSLSAVPQTTLGYEKLFNWAFQHREEASFVEAALAGQPEPPMYFAEMKRVNRDGPPVGDGAPPRRMPDDRLAGELEKGVAVLDTRDRHAIEEGSVPGCFYSPFESRSFLTWAGSVLPFDRDFHLIADEGDVERLVADLRLIGLDRVRGVFSPSAVTRWIDEHPDSVTSLPERDPARLEEEMRNGDADLVVDVRNPSERAERHIPGSVNLPLATLVDRLDEIPRHRPIVVHCQSGARALVAMGALRAHGFTDVRHLVGDMAEWVRDGRPTRSGTGG